MTGLRRPRRLGLEQLEGRQLMAGLVTITTRTVTAGGVTTTELILTGDASPNGLHLTNDGRNRYIVDSINTGTPNDQGTRFRLGATGTATDRIVLTGIGENFILTVKMAEGDDKYVYDQRVPVNASNNYLNFLDANIDMGFGAKDTVETTNLRLSRDWKIWGGQSQTPPQLQAPVISLGRGGFNNVGRNFCYWGGNGNDDITLLATNIVSHVLLPPDPGTPTNPNTYLAVCQADTPANLFAGNDKFTISNAPTGRVTVGTATSTAANSIFRLDAGPGNDAISSTGMSVNQMRWNLNDGDDTVFFQATNIRWNSEIDGGVGYDLHTESNSNPRNNFRDGNGNFILDADNATPPVTPPFTTPPRQGTSTNPNGAELRYVSFENGQTRPPPINVPGGGGGGGGAGGRWTFRRGDTVVVSTATSPNAAGLQNILSPAQPSESNMQASASIVDDRLVISGTDANDLILVSDAGEGQIRVRVNSQILGIFPAGLGIAVETFGGNDYVYIAPSIGLSTMVSMSASDDWLVGGRNVLLLESGTVYSNQQAAEHPQFVLEHTPAANDLALLQILGLPADVSESSGPIFGRRPS